MKAPKRRKIFLITVAILVVASVVYGFIPAAVPVDVITAKRGPMRVTFEEEGRTRVKDRFVISAPVTGYLQRIALQPGDPAGIGQQVAVLDPLRIAALDPRSRAEAEAEVAAAKAALDAAIEKARAAAADAEYARERRARAAKLFEGGYIAKDDQEHADTDAKKADAILSSADATVATARADLRRAGAVLRYSAAEPEAAGRKVVIVRSPCKGNVLKRNRESEGVVNAGDPLLEIGNPANLEVDVQVLSADAVQLHPGTVVLFERWGGREPLAGKVRIVEPAGFTKVSSLGVEEQRVNVIVDFTSPFSLWQRLGDGYRLDATFVVWEGQNVLQAPVSGLFRKGEGWALYVEEDGRAQLREVKIGRRNGVSAEVLQGLSAGEAVIANPDDAVQEGERVEVRGS